MDSSTAESPCYDNDSRGTYIRDLGVCDVAEGDRSIVDRSGYEEGKNSLILGDINFVLAVVLYI